MNRVVIVGRLRRDRDLRYTPNDVAVATFTVAANRPLKNQQGEQDADVINCVVWTAAAENIANYMKKSSMIGVDGRLQSRRYDGKDGKTVFVTEVVADTVQFLEPKNSTNQGPSNQGQFAQRQGQQTAPSNNQTSNDPFKTDGEPIDISEDRKSV